MANMSYCRFENTYRDLHDCVEAAEELADARPRRARPLSESEQFYMQEMIELAKRFIAAAEAAK